MPARHLNCEFAPQLIHKSQRASILRGIFCVWSPLPLLLSCRPVDSIQYSSCSDFVFSFLYRDCAAGITFSYLISAILCISLYCCMYFRSVENTIFHLL